VRLYGRALSAQQMAALYRCSSGQADLSVAGRGALYEFPVFPQGAVEFDGCTICAIPERDWAGSSSRARWRVLGGLAARRQPG